MTIQELARQYSEKYFKGNWDKSITASAYIAGATETFSMDIAPKDKEILVKDGNGVWDVAVYDTDYRDCYRTRNQRVIYLPQCWKHLPS